MCTNTRTMQMKTIEATCCNSSTGHTGLGFRVLGLGFFKGLENMYVAKVASFLNNLI